MISHLAVRFFTWYAVRILRFPHIVLKHDGRQEVLEGITFAYSGEYADEVSKLSFANHRADYKENSEYDQDNYRPDEPAES